MLRVQKHIDLNSCYKVTVKYVSLFIQPKQWHIFVSNVKNKMQNECIPQVYK